MRSASTSHGAHRLQEPPALEESQPEPAPAAHPDLSVVIHSLAIAVACIVSYWLTTHLLTRLHSVSSSDDFLGGMWATVATVFVYHNSRTEDTAAALSRIAATLLSFVLCLAYLLVFPFNVFGLGVLIGAGAAIMQLLGRPGDVVTTGITTTVVMVVAAMSPNRRWEQPILRLFDTVVGVAVALAAAWVAGRVERLLHRRIRT